MKKISLKKLSDKEYTNSKIEVNIKDLELVLKAAKRCLQFAIQSDILLGSGLAVEDEEMSAAYKNIMKHLNNSKEKLKKKIRG